MEIDIKDEVLSYRFGKEKESFSSDLASPRQGEIYLFEKFDFEIPKITPS